MIQHAKIQRLNIRDKYVVSIFKDTNTCKETDFKYESNAISHVQNLGFELVSVNEGTFKEMWFKKVTKG